MFQSARLKLTFWYILITMSVSILFSLAFFYVVDNELHRNFRRFEQRFERDLGINSRELERLSLNRIINAENMIIRNLFYVNLTFFVLASLAGYFLAGRVLKPIQKMVDEQNRFISDASHELRTPLTAMKTSIEVHVRDKKLNLSEAKKVLNNNLTDLEDLQNLTNNLLSVAQFQSKENMNNFTEFNIKEIINKAIEKVSVLAKTKNIRISHSGMNVYIYADEDKLLQLFIIFLDNAIKYSPPKKRVIITHSVQKNNILIRIQDFGVGIQKENLPYIFNRFYREEESRTKNVVHGHGLGLSIAKNIIDLHKGNIHVESIPNKGSTFIIELPIIK